MLNRSLSNLLSRLVLLVFFALWDVRFYPFSRDPFWACGGGYASKSPSPRYELEGTFGLLCFRIFDQDRRSLFEPHFEIGVEMCYHWRVRILLGAV